LDIGKKPFRVLITGGRGMLASDMAGTFSATTPWIIKAPGHGELDVTAFQSLKEALTHWRPNMVVHTGAVTDADLCQRQPELAYRVNAWGTANVARICGQLGIELVYISTCGVFDDEIKANTEYNPVTLKTHYARAKYEGELAVKEFTPRHYIIRPGWLFGGLPHHRKNFVYRRYLECFRKPVVLSAGDRFGSPSYTVDLAVKIRELVGTGAYGTYHIVNEGLSSRHEYVQEIARCFKLGTTIEETTSQQFPRVADVPFCEALDNFNLRLLGLKPMAPWQDALARYVHRLKKMLNLW